MVHIHPEYIDIHVIIVIDHDWAGVSVTNPSVWVAGRRGRFATSRAPGNPNLGVCYTNTLPVVINPLNHSCMVVQLSYY